MNGKEDKDKKDNPYTHNLSKTLQTLGLHFPQCSPIPFNTPYVVEKTLMKLNKRPP